MKLLHRIVDFLSQNRTNGKSRFGHCDLCQILTSSLFQLFIKSFGKLWVSAVSSSPGRMRWIWCSPSCWSEGIETWSILSVSQSAGAPPPLCLSCSLHQIPKCCTLVARKSFCRHGNSCQALQSTSPHMTPQGGRAGHVTQAGWCSAASLTLLSDWTGTLSRKPLL